MLYRNLFHFKNYFFPPKESPTAITKGIITEAQRFPVINNPKRTSI